ncbi:MAG: hypothetical protein OQK11_06635 [Thiovulaceae bacterium]|nr:hypothetical protein [Sulfurimonadaceae bacterium]
MIDVIIFFLLIFGIPIVVFIAIIKFWKKGIAGKIFSIFLSIPFIGFSSGIIADVGFNYCGLKLEQAETKVIKYLKKENLNVQKLKFVGNDGSCAYHFKYLDDKNDIDFTILSTWLHGVKLTHYDNELLPNKTLEKNTLP